MFGVKFLQQKLGRDIAWTMGSFMVLAVSGIVINVVVASLRDAAALGVFNQAYAVYIIASQIAVCGVHYSVLRHAAFFDDDAEERGAMLFTSIVLTLLFGVLAAIALYVFAPLLGRAFDSVVTGEAIRYAAYGLVFFPLNKVLLGYLNGLRHMKMFAILQASRYIFVMVWVSIVAASSDVDFKNATLAFFVAEFATTLIAMVYLLLTGLLSAMHFSLKWIKKHVVFGSKSLLAGMFVEMNSRVDVLMIGLFLPDRAVGIYSFAAMLVDGLYHVLAMVRINFNPVLVGALRDKKWEAMQGLLKKAKQYAYPVTLFLALLVLGVFWVMANYIVPEKGLQEGIYSLLILLAGLTLISAFIPFDNLLLVSGHPGFQTFQHMTVVTANIGLNYTLVPILGIEGAALATISGYIVGMIVLMILVNHFLRWNLLTNRVVA